MAAQLRLILVLVALAQTPAATSPQTPPPTPQQAAIDQLIKDADAASRSNDIDTMLRLADDVIAQSRAIDDMNRLAQGVSAKARAFWARQQPRQCVDTLREAIAVFDRITSLNVKFTIANNAGNCFIASNQADDAVAWQQQAAQLAHELRNPGLESQVAGNVGLMFVAMGEPALGEEWAQRAIAIATDAKDDLRRAFGLSTFAFAALSDPPTAIPRFREVIAAFEKVASSPALKAQAAVPFGSLAVMEAVVGQDEAAIRDADEYRVRHAALGSGFDGSLASSVGAKGMALFHLGRLSEAETVLLEARTIWSRLDGQSDLIAGDRLLTELVLARVLRAQGRRAEAFETLRAILAAFDRFRTGRSSATALELVAVGVYRAFSEMADMLIADGRTGEAFELSERYRARVFLDQLDEQRRGDSGMSPVHAAREAELATDAVKLQLKALSPSLTTEERATTRSQLQSIDLALDAVRADVRRTSPRSGLRFTTNETLADIQRSLPRDTVVVSYLTGQDRSLVFGITSTQTAAGVLPGEAALKQSVDAYAKQIATRPSPGASRAAALRREAARLSSVVFDTVTPLFAGKTRIIVIPDGPLHSVPFEALTTPGSPTVWLAERYVVSYAPSMTALIALAAAPASPPSATLFAVGDPATGAPAGTTRGPDVPFTALPYTRVEVARISKLLAGSVQVLGADATKRAILSAPLDRYRYIHVAAHAFVNAVRPGRSGIVLAPMDKDAGASILQVEDIQTLRLNADLVTLSACSTASGRAVLHEGVMSLARAFLLAGSKSVAASLWNVNDEATAVLMARFYTELTAGKPRDEALSAARLSLIRGTNARLKDPYYWAPFILIGAAR